VGSDWHWSCGVKKLKLVNLLVTFCLLGVVDQVHGNHVQAELTDVNGVSKAIDLPLWMFPCEVKEGDMFYFTKADGVLELRCGEPQG